VNSDSEFHMHRDPIPDGTDASPDAGGDDDKHDRESIVEQLLAEVLESDSGDGSTPLVEQDGKKRTQEAKERWMSNVIAEEEADAAAANASAAESATERRWVKHLLHELEEEVRRGTELTREELVAEVKWIHETAKQIAREGTTELHRHPSHPDAKKLQAWLDAVKHTPRADGAQRLWMQVDATNSMETMSCSRKDVSFEPMDMEGHPMTIESTVAACQARCQRVPECAHFSYWEPAGHCHIQDAFAVPQPSRLLFVAGPPGCRLREENRQTLSILRKKFTHCYEANTAYGPYDLQIGAVKTHSIEKCQALCRWTPGCSHFTYWTLGGLCHLSSEVADGEERIAGVADFVAGPPVCFARAPKDLVNHIKMRRRFLELPGSRSATVLALTPASSSQSSRLLLLVASGFLAVASLTLAAMAVKRRHQRWTRAGPATDWGPLTQTFARAPLDEHV